MILLLSGSVLYAQNLNNEFNNAKSEKENNLEMLQKKQFIKENAQDFQIPGLNKYYKANTSAYQASAEKQIVETVPANFNTSLSNALPDNDPTQFTGKGGISMTDDPALLLCPSGSQLSQDAMGTAGSWTFGSSDDNPAENYQVAQWFSGLGTDITSITWWGLLLEYNAGWTVCTPPTKDFIVTVYADDGAGLPDESVVLYTETVTLTSTATGEIYASLYEALSWSYVPSPALIASISEGWLVIQGTGGTACWFLWLNAATQPGPACWQWGGTAWTTDDTRSLCFGGSALDHDVACTAIVQPNSGEGLTATETVEISVYNAGANVESFFDVYFQIDGAPPVTETFNGPINPGETLPYIFTATADLSTVGQVYTINACTGLVGDLNAGNDCTVKTVENEEPCVVVCPPGATDEGEGIIPDDTNDITNGGCNSDPNVFGSVVCGETVCGSSGFYVTNGSTYRDTDWYVLDLSGYTYPQNVTVEFEAGYTMLGGIVAGPCATAAFLTNAIPGPCEVATVTATGLAQAGEYWIWMGADFTGDDADWSPYYFTVTCEDAPPPPPHDAFCAPMTIVVDDPPITDDNSFATIETWEQGGSCWFGADPPSHSLWYSFVAPATGAVSLYVLPLVT